MIIIDVFLYLPVAIYFLLSKHKRWRKLYRTTEAYVLQCVFVMRLSIKFQESTNVVEASLMLRSCKLLVGEASENELMGLSHTCLKVLGPRSNYRGLGVYCQISGIRNRLEIGFPCHSSRVHFMFITTLARLVSQNRSALPLSSSH